MIRLKGEFYLDGELTPLDVGVEGRAHLDFALNATGQERLELDVHDDKVTVTRWDLTREADDDRRIFAKKRFTVGYGQTRAVTEGVLAGSIMPGARIQIESPTWLPTPSPFA